MIKRPMVRRLGDAFVAFATWTSAAAAVMWFYDWVSRWYIVVGVLLVIVAGASLGDRLKSRDDPAAAMVAELLPVPREPVAESDLAAAPLAAPSLAAASLAAAPLAAAPSPS